MPQATLITIEASSLDAANLIVQSVVALAAVAAAIAALVIASKDRKHAAELAERDREHAQALAEGAQAHAEAVAAEQARKALENAKLMFDLDVMVRLHENIVRRGSSDQQESKRMGAEALALIGVLGPKVVPRQWADQVGEDEALLELLNDESEEQFLRNRAETQLAVNRMIARLADEISGRADGDTGGRDAAEMD
jgi:hypothetical protein